tara:strand:- start:84 stop:878 length:795 start_codon:yes stop_codon:yes gene_type:complete
LEKFDINNPLRGFDFSDEVAIVTGGARGIGLAISQTLAKLGATVVIADLEEDVINFAQSNLVPSGFYMTCDVTKENDVEQLIQFADNEFGRIDMLVNNAGIAIRDSSVNLSLVDWQKVLDVNMTAVFSVARVAVRKHVDRKDASSVLRIVNMASMMGLSGGGIYANPSYQASKGAVINMTRAMAVEWGSKRVRVNALAPTWVRTDLISPLLSDKSIVKRMEDAMPIGRLAEVEDVAGAAMFLLSPAAAMITGHTLAVDGGYLSQ